MGGSYRHITNSKNELNDMSTIENLHDAGQCIRQCHALIKILSGNNKQRIYEAALQCPEIIHPENRDLITFERYWD